MPVILLCPIIFRIVPATPRIFESVVFAIGWRLSVADNLISPVGPAATTTSRRDHGRAASWRNVGCSCGYNLTSGLRRERYSRCLPNDRAARGDRRRLSGDPQHLSRVRTSLARNTFARSRYPPHHRRQQRDHAAVVRAAVAGTQPASHQITNWASLMDKVGYSSFMCQRGEVPDSHDPGRPPVQTNLLAESPESDPFPDWFTASLHDRQTRKPSAHTMRA
jgi:hypothetical protein